MTEMTFPEFQAAVEKTNIALIPMSAIEEHGPHLPLSTDSIIVLGQLGDVQSFLRKNGVDTIIGPLLQIGVTTEAEDWSRDGTYAYPGSLTIGIDTFVALYLDLIRSMREKGLRRFFLYSGHYGPRHLKAMVRIAEEAREKINDAQVYALIHAETMQRLQIHPTDRILAVERGRNFELLDQLLGHGPERPTSTHADGAETSEVLYRNAEAVRAHFQRLPESPSSRFFEAYKVGRPELNPSGMGGYPTTRASAEVGRMIGESRARSIGVAILQAVRGP
jgi:creatinine amidohydrolase